MRRVVVTGIGIVSSIGNNKEEVLNSLRNGISGNILLMIMLRTDLDLKCMEIKN